MASYIVKRLLYGALTLFLVATVTFFLMNLIPGGPFLSEKAPSAETTAALEEKFGLDKPLGEQYLSYMGGLLQGDLGPSIKQRGRTVAGIIAAKFPVSAKVGLVAILLSLAVGIPLGSVAALKRGRALDNGLLVLGTVGISIPSFVTSIILLLVFGATLKWLPTFGLSSFKHYIMPVIALALYPASYIMRLVRSSMLDVLGQDYIRAARAKGLSQRTLLFKHALRNACLPVITYLGPLLAYTLVGSFVVEKIFTIPGLGMEFISSITNRDYPMVMGITIFLAALIIAMNVLVDIVYKIVDPRIQLK